MGGPQGSHAPLTARGIQPPLARPDEPAARGRPSAEVYTSLCGHPTPTKREEFVEAVFLKMHEVVVAVELTAAMTAHHDVFEQARQVRRRMDATVPWKYSGAEGSA